jgi:uncharacterized protein
MKKIKEINIPAQSGAGFSVKKGQVVRVIDVCGGQVADLVCFSSVDLAEKLSTGVTLDNNSSLFIKEGDFLFSSKYKKMLKVRKDTVGKHDILYPACSPQMFSYQYKTKGYHPSCLENLGKSLEEFGVKESDIPTPFNIFQNSQVSSDGSLKIEEPLSKAGDFIDLKALMDLYTAVSACSVLESKCNAFKCTPIKIEIYELK